MSWPATKTYTASVTVHVIVSDAAVQEIIHLFLDARAAGKPVPKIAAIKLLRQRTKVLLHDGTVRTLSLKDAKEIVEDIFAAL